MSDSSTQKKLLFLGLNHDQLPYLQVLQELDYFIIGADQNAGAPGAELCDQFHQIGYDETDKLIRLGKDYSFSNEDKVFTAAAQFAHVGASSFAKFFGIFYPSQSSIEICLDKVKFYQSFSDNNLPIPETTIIKNQDELKIILSNMHSSYYYLKSDFSKNPNYVYRFHSDHVPWTDICWVKDRYYRNNYVLQQEYPGVSLRINTYGNRFNVFNFETDRLTLAHHQAIKELGIIELLNNFRDVHLMNRWLLKFDIILNQDSYVVLDVGMEPPMRMLKHSKLLGINFEEYYIHQYLENLVDYPNILDEPIS